MPDHLGESITGLASRRMLEHYSHIGLKAKKAALDRLDDSRVDVADQAYLSETENSVRTV
jgi:hypothetical protein